MGGLTAAFFWQPPPKFNSSINLFSILPEIIRKPMIFDDFVGNISKLIRSNSLNIQSEIWRQALTQ